MTSKFLIFAAATAMLAGSGAASFAQSSGETRTAPGQRDSMKGGAGGSNMNNQTGGNTGSMNNTDGMNRSGAANSTGSATTTPTDGVGGGSMSTTRTPAR